MRDEEALHLTLASFAVTEEVLRCVASQTKTDRRTEEDAERGLGSARRLCPTRIGSHMASGIGRERQPPPPPQQPPQQPQPPPPTRCLCSQQRALRSLTMASMPLVPAACVLTASYPSRSKSIPMPVSGSLFVISNTQVSGFQSCFCMN